MRSISTCCWTLGLLLVALSPWEVDASNDQVWHIAIKHSDCGHPAVAQDGTLYVPLYEPDTDFGPPLEGEDALYAIAPNGKVRWRPSMPGVRFSHAAMDLYGNVFVLTDAGRLLKISPSGKVLGDVNLVKWAKGIHPHEALLLGDLLVTKDTVYVLGYTFGTQNILIALKPTMEIKWYSNLGPRGLVRERCLLWHPNKLIIIGLTNGELCAVREEGRVSWWTSFLSGDPLSCSLGPGGIIYASSLSGELVNAITPSGKVLWSYDGRPSSPVEGFEVQGPPMIDRDGTVFTVVRDQTLTALSSSGKVLWKFKIPHQVTWASNPLQLFDGSPVFSAVGETDGAWIYRVSRDGKRAWRRWGGEAVKLTLSPDRKVVYAAGLSISKEKTPEERSIAMLDPLKWPELPLPP